jgi:hypothetical protein
MAGLVPAIHAVIARSEATKQSRSCLRKLDCFAALAMTTEKQKSPAATAGLLIREREEKFL